METADRYALTASDCVCAIGTQSEIEKLCRWNRITGNSSKPYNWDMYWVDEDRRIDPGAPSHFTPPSGPLVDKLFVLLNETSLDSQYHYEMWWCVKFLKEMESSGIALVRIGRYTCGYRDLAPAPELTSPSYWQDVEDTHRSYLYWLDDFKRGESKEAILVNLNDPSTLQGDAIVLNAEKTIALLELHLASLPARPKITRDESNLFFYSQSDKVHYEAVKAEAGEKGLLEQFEQAIRDRCINYADHKVFYRCALYRDLYTMNFGWRPEYKESEGGDWKAMFPGGGGLIYHEYCQGWSTHT